MSTSSLKLISLENFDPNSRKEPIINSPRSLLACKKQGIAPSELLIKNANDMKELYKGRALDKESLELQLIRYEEKRKEKLKILLDV